MSTRPKFSVRVTAAVPKAWHYRAWSSPSACGGATPKRSMRRPAQICSFERRFASLGFLKAHMRRLWIGLIVLPDVLAVVNRTCNLAPRLHHGEGLCFRVLAQRLFGVEVPQCRNPISDAHAALLCQGRAIRPISPTRGAAGTPSVENRSVRCGVA